MSCFCGLRCVWRETMVPSFRPLAFVVPETLISVRGLYLEMQCGASGPPHARKGRNPDAPSSHPLLVPGSFLDVCWFLPADQQIGKPCAAASTYTLPNRLLRLECALAECDMSLSRDTRVARVAARTAIDAIQTAHFSSLQARTRRSARICTLYRRVTVPRHG